MVLLAAHLIAFLPGAVLAALRSKDARYWLIAAAFAASAVADLVALNLTGPTTWAVYYVLSPVQFGLIAWALGRPSFALILVGVAIGQAVYIEPGTPDVLLTVMGSVGVLALAKNTRFAWTLLTYCGLGTALYLMMIARIDDYGAFMPWWYAYQTARLAAFALFGRAVWRTA